MTNATSSQETNRMDPITETEYALIIRTAHSARPGETQQQAALRAAVDIAAIGVTRDGLLGPGAAAEARWHDLRCEQDGSGRLTVKVSKADPDHLVYLSATTMTALGEMFRTKREMGIDTEQDDRLFQMGSRQLARRIRNACGWAGLEGRYGGSSPRLGMMMDLMEEDVSMVALTAARRWKNPTIVEHFLREEQVSRGAVAQWHALRQGTDPPA